VRLVSIPGKRDLYHGQSSVVKVFSVPDQRAPPDPDIMQRARTEIFYLFLIFKLTIAVSFRSFRYSIVQAPPQKWLVLAILWNWQSSQRSSRCRRAARRSASSCRRPGIRGSSPDSASPTCSAGNRPRVPRPEGSGAALLPNLARDQSPDLDK